MPNIADRDRSWLTDHPDLTEWLESWSEANRYPVLTYLREWLTNHLTLTARQTEIVNGLRRDLEAGQLNRAREMNVSTVRGVHGYDPASAGDMSNIFNGNYTVVDSLGRTFEYQIYTATRGELRGQRLIKYLMPGSGRYQAFATILRDGSFHLWRRFAPDIDDAWVTAASAMLYQLQTTEFVHRDYNARQWIGNLTISSESFCRYCNRAIHNGGESARGIHAECLTRLQPEVVVIEGSAEGSDWVQELTNPPTPRVDVLAAAIPDDDIDITEVEIWQCDQCTHEAVSRPDLWEHQHLVHPAWYPFVCSTCRHPFHTTAQRSSHRRVAHPIRRPLQRQRPNTTPATPAAPRPGRVNMSQIDPTWPQ